MTINRVKGGGYPLQPNGGPVEWPSLATPESTPNGGKAPKGAAGVNDDLQLTSGSLRLLELESSSTEAPLDSEKVVALREAINQGRYHVSSRELAEKVLDLEQVLFREG